MMYVETYFLIVQITVQFFTYSVCYIFIYIRNVDTIAMFVNNTLQ